MMKFVFAEKVCKKFCFLPAVLAIGSNASCKTDRKDVLKMEAAKTILGKKDNKKALHLIVKTTEGPIKGFEQKGVRKFLGIPYVGPPVDEFRWKRAPKATPRPQGTVFDASKYGNYCHQVNSAPKSQIRKMMVEMPGHASENCLTLNIFASSQVRFAARKTKNRLAPVIVFVHGGIYSSGSASAHLYNPTKLAKRQDVVMVTVNYRLNWAGLLASRQLKEEAAQKVQNHIRLKNLCQFIFCMLAGWKRVLWKLCTVGRDRCLAVDQEEHCWIWRRPAMRHPDGSLFGWIIGQFAAGCHGKSQDGFSNTWHAILDTFVSSCDCDECIGFGPASKKCQ